MTKANDPRPVRCITTGEEFPSCSSAERKYKINKTVGLCCKGKQKHAGHLEDGTLLSWEYINEDGYIINEEEEKNAVEAALSNKEELLNKFKGEKKDKEECVVDEGGKKRYPRDPKVAANALKIGHYKCAIDIDHPSFTRKRDGENYTEPHHLIPISYHDDFEYSLDVEENIISLCSTCHNCLHYGIDTERIKLLEKLYDERNEVLKNVGLEITLEELKKYYKIID